MQLLFERVRARPAELNLDTARWIILSDHHRGQRDGADDFLRCEAAYHAALGYYLEAGHRLVLLGDVEELWESRPSTVMAAYPNTLALEAQFYEDGRYQRYAGNHDDEWASRRAVKRFLDPVHPGIEVLEGGCFRVSAGGSALGTLLLAHGHQGLYWADRYRRLSRFLNRKIWRPLQRLLRVPSTTPARDFKLRNRHDRSMYAWTARQEKLILVAGHTHRPVFMGSSHQARVEEQLTRLLEDERAKPPSPDRLTRMAELRAELEWTKVQDDEHREHAPPDRPKPCYFNSGCCSFGDGSITGIEIAGGTITLVRWPDRHGAPRPQILAAADLETEVFAAL
ncbi:MAG TPA: metallophosphoesterase [Gemmatimonadota bacterium]|nr:metallophosphoesterase [Gemmatimonadota bacterium]